MSDKQEKDAPSLTDAERAAANLVAQALTDFAATLPPSCREPAIAAFREALETLLGGRR